ncbi:MAG TPA: BON domain-containing protein [Polyangiaceae bacterium]|nr:BON domain-containing protein [Polyangiaceae bacterium]
MTSFSKMPVCWALSSALALAACSKGKTGGEQPPPAASARAATVAAPRQLKDADVTRATEEAFARDPGIDPGLLHVNTTNGIVELTGSVGDILTKRRATQLAETIRGVRAVSDRIQVVTKARPDPDLERDVKDALSINAATDTLPITVSVRDAVVTLSGTVHSGQEQKIAERVAESVKGVRAVDNHTDLVVGAPRDDREILADVKSRFRWDRLLNDGLLEVAVANGKVTLSGVAGSATERRRAEREAWVRGVTKVDASKVNIEWWAKQDDLLREKPLKYTDNQIAKAIRDAAALDPRVESAGLTVDVAKGIATLGGTVGSVQAKNAAESLAHNTVGVVDVKDELAVEPRKPVSDRLLAKRVTQSLAYDPALGSLGLEATSDGGTVTLTGAVESTFERAEATEVAAAVRGVRRVQNQLAVKRPEVAYVYSFYLDPYEPFIESWHYAPAKPVKPDAQIASQIKMDLAFAPLLDEKRVDVSVKGGTAVLTGTVDSLGERAIATEDAFEGGAIAVENRLQVAAPGG